jgi:hypothetical protein
MIIHGAVKTDPAVVADNKALPQPAWMDVRLAEMRSCCECHTSHPVFLSYPFILTHIYTAATPIVPAFPARKVAQSVSRQVILSPSSHTRSKNPSLPPHSTHTLSARVLLSFRSQDLTCPLTKFVTHARTPTLFATANCLALAV